MATTSLADLIRNADPKQTEFGLIPPGEYEAIVYECELTKSKTQNPMFKVTYKIIEGDFENRRVWDYVTLTDKTVGFAVAKLLAMGAESQEAIAEALGSEKKGLAVCKQMVDSRVTIKLRITKGTGDYEGTESNKVTFVEASKTTSQKAFDDDDDDDGAAAKAAAKAAKKAAKSTSRPTTPF